MKKLSRKLLAVMLSMLMAISVIPVATLAETTQTMEETQNSNPDLYVPGEQDAEPAPILTEVTGLREENVKHFRLEDGTYLAAQYDQPVHYEENGEWKDIDNTLILQSAQDSEDVDGYVNTDNPFKIKLAKHADSKKLVKMKQGQYQLSWSYAAADNHNPARALEVEPIDVSEDTTVDPKAVLNNLTSGMAYDEIEPGIDLQYILSSTSLKENIVVKQKRDSYSFVLNLNVKKMTPAIQEDGRINFCNADGDSIFTIPAPFMTDADGAYSQAVHYMLESGQKDGEYTLTISADADWMNASDRVFPVTIDPIVSTPQGTVPCTVKNIQSNNGANVDQTVSKIGQEDGLSNRVYMEFDLEEVVPNNAMVTGAILSLAMSADQLRPSWNERKIEVHDGCLNEKSSTDTGPTIYTVNWSNQRATSTIIDAYPAPSGTSVMQFDITKLVKRWTEDHNSGLMLRSSDEANVGYHWFAGPEYTNAGSRPILALYYTDAKGLESHWSYHTQSVGKVTSSINDFNGNLVLSHTDLTNNNLRMPFSVVHVYNSAKVYETYGKFGSNSPYGLQTGKGFQLNLQQRIDPITDAALQDYGYAYVWLDSDGTQHYFKEAQGETNTWKDEDGLNLTLTKETIQGVAYLYLADKEENLSIFHEDTGLLYYITDNLIDNNNIVVKRKNYIKLSYDGTVLEKIYNPEGQLLVTFVHNSANYLTQIKDRSGRITQYSYNNWNQLTTIKYPDNTTMKFDYFTNSAPYMVTGPDNTRLCYSYVSGSAGRIKWVKQQSTSSGSTQWIDGQRIDFAYLGNNCTGFTYTTRTGNSVSEMYEFDRYGRVFNIEDLDGGAASCVYTPQDNDKTKNRIVNASTTQKYVNNLLDDSSFEGESSKWVPFVGIGGAGSKSFSTNAAYLGQKSIEIISRSSSGAIGYSQKIDVSPNTTYTLSAYLKSPSDIGANFASIFVQYYDETNYYIDGESKAGIIKQGNEWQRVVLTFTTPSNADNIDVGIQGLSYYTFYFDCIQLEKGEAANDYVLLSNTDFADNGPGAIPVGWSASNTSNPDGRSSESNVMPGYYGIYLNGDWDKIKWFYQDVIINKPASQVAFSVSGKGMGDSLPWTYQTFGFRLQIYYDDNTIEMPELIRLNPDTGALQTVTKTICASQANLSKTITKVRYIMEYGNNLNGAYFYQPQLKLDQTGSTYTYDTEGNLISAKDNANRNSTYNYDVTTQNLTDLTNPENEQTEYEYSQTNPHQVVAVRQNATDTSLAVEYDGYGNVTKSTYYAGTGDVQQAAEKAVTSATYTNYGYSPYTSTDALGNMSIYTYHFSKNLLTETTDPMGNEVQYFYNSDNDRIISAVGRRDKNSASTEVAVDYTYNDKGYLSQVDHNNFYYGLTYNSFGNLSGVSVGKDSSSLNLVTNSYYSGNGPLSQVRYANGDKVNYTYDKLDRLDTVSYDNVESYRYAYDARGNLARLTALNGGQTVQYQYDILNRITNVFKGNSFNIDYSYDNMDRLTQVTYHTSFSSGRSTSYSYGPGSRPTGTTLPNGKSIEINYDTLGRLDFTSHQLSEESDDNEWLVRYYYNTGSSGSQSGQVNLIQGLNAAENKIYQTYEYDANGNITHWYDGTTFKHTYYHYDGLNQLVREDNQASLYTMVYNYDNGGNLVSKTRYNYTTAETPSGTSQTFTYSYNDPVWGDKLTSYNGSTITYDNSGNPLGYRNGISFTWEQGRQMKSMNKGGILWEYSYDANGYRTKKKQGNSTWEYMLDGSRVICMKTPTKTVWFDYDANGQRVAMTVSGTTYYYIYNAMGDVVGLYDASGNVVAKYVYNAWGQIVSVSKGNGTRISQSSNPDEPGIINPFRYRGYMYDEESGFYYLNSRYYDPETGRFINADNFLVGDSVLGMNLYAYCVNNPVNLADPSGQFVLSFAAICTLAAKAVATVVMLAVAIPLTMELGETMADGLSGITAQPIPAETPTIDISPSIEKEEVTTVPVPDEATQEATKTQNRPRVGYYYGIELTYPGITVYLSSEMSYDQAMQKVLQGIHVWTPTEPFAFTLTYFASGAPTLITMKGESPFDGPNEAGVRQGYNAYHYHLLNRACNDVHIFWGYQAVQFV